jgi:hypothetical protein
MSKRTGSVAEAAEKLIWKGASVLRRNSAGVTISR